MIPPNDRGARPAPAEGAPPPGDVVGVLLAAGGGARYGMPKALAEDGRWLAAGVAALRAGGCGTVFVVLGAAHPQLPVGALPVDNPRWREGMATSLAAGLAAADRTPAPWVVLHLVDLPGVGADVVRRLLAERGPAGLARASYDGIPGHPVVAGRTHWAGLAEAAAGDRGGAAYLRAHSGLRLVPCEDLADGRDVDAP